MMEGEGKMGGGMGGGMMNMCKCPHHKIVPLIIFVIGLLFFLNAVNVITVSALNILWPLAVMIAGLMKMMSRRCACCGNKC